MGKKQHQTPRFNQPDLNGQNQTEDEEYSSDSHEASTSTSGATSNPQGQESGPRMQWDRLNTLYDLVHKLNQITKKPIPLSKVYVCGTQSSGKTSLLENIMGQDLLPKGKNMQTRCPIVLQLIRAICKKGVEAEVIFDHLPGKVFTDMTKVKDEIETISKKIADSGLEVRDEPIRIRLTSPNVWDLTLVDLPGLTTKALAGQDEKLPKRIEQLVKMHIENPKSIILVVAEATIDAAKESYALTLAQEVDPEGKRTLGVLTKLDMMNEGDTAYDMLTGKLVHLEQGFVGVINRKTLEVKNNTGFDQLRKREKEFFEKNYPDMADIMGIEYLVTVVGDLLQRTVSEELPGIKTEIERMVGWATAKLKRLGPANEPAQNRVLLTNYLNTFKEKYCAQVDGRRRCLDTKSLVASAKIKNVFNRIFSPEVEALQGAVNIPAYEIDIAVFSSCGLHSLDNIPDDAFQEFAKRDVARMKPIVDKCMKEVHALMLETIHSCTDPSMSSKYPMLNINIDRVVTNLINEHNTKCQSYLDRTLKVWTTFAHTSNADFLKKRQELKYKFATGSKQSTVVATRAQPQGATTSNGGGSTSDGTSRTETLNHVELEDSIAHKEYVVQLVRCYFDKVKEFIKDHVPNSIASEFVYATVDNLNNALMLQLFDADMIDTLMSESNVVTQDRRNTVAALDGFKKAKDVIDNMMKTNQ